MVAVVESPPNNNPVPIKHRVEELKKTISASRLNTWQSCRLKFFFRYVLRLKRAKSPAQYLGSMVHLVLKQWNLARWRNEKTSMEVMRLQFDERWPKEQEDERVKWDPGEEPEFRKMAWSLLQLYFLKTPIPATEKPEGVEVPVEADLGNGLPVLIGVLDLVRQGGLIVDYKTVGQTPNAERAAHLNETQLSCYSVLYREATGRKEAGLELHNLVKLKVPRLVVVPINPMSQQQETRLFKLIESYLNGLDRQDWIPSPNAMSCACCEFFNECRNWR